MIIFEKNNSKIQIKNLFNPQSILIINISNKKKKIKKKKKFKIKMPKPS